MSDSDSSGTSKNIKSNAINIVFEDMDMSEEGSEILDSIHLHEHVYVSCTEKYCSSCGKVIKRLAEICPKCGVRVLEAPIGQVPVVVNLTNTNTNATTSENKVTAESVATASTGGTSLRRVGSRSKFVAAILAFFLGSFGVHKFYLGRPFQGILYLIFFWTFIPGFIGFIEGIILLFSNDNMFNIKYNSVV